MNKIPGKMIEVSIGDRDKNVQDFMSAVHTIPVEVFMTTTLNQAVLDAIAYLKIEKRGEVVVPATSTYNELRIKATKNRVNSALQLKFETKDSAIPVGTAGRPYTGGNWEPGDVVLNNNMSSTSKDYGWVCITAGKPGVWGAIISGGTVSQALLDQIAKNTLDIGDWRNYPAVQDVNAAFDLNSTSVQTIINGMRDNSSVTCIVTDANAAANNDLPTDFGGVLKIRKIFDTRLGLRRSVVSYQEEENYYTRTNVNGDISTLSDWDRHLDVNSDEVEMMGQVISVMNIKTYTSVTQLGLVANTATLQAIINAMPLNSVLYATSTGLPANTFPTVGAVVFRKFTALSSTIELIPSDSLINKPSFYMRTDVDNGSLFGIWNQSAFGLYANMTIYVSSSGSDTTGKGTSALPYASVNKALSVVPKNLNGFNAIINIANGAYTENVNISGFHGGRLYLIIPNSGTVTLHGTLSVSNTDDFILQSSVASNLIINNSTVANGGLFIDRNSSFSDYLVSITVNGATTVHGIFVNNNSKFFISQPVTLNNCGNGMFVSSNSHGYAETITGTGNVTGVRARSGSSVTWNTLSIGATTIKVKESGSYFPSEFGPEIVISATEPADKSVIWVN